MTSVTACGPDISGPQTPTSPPETHDSPSNDLTRRTPADPAAPPTQLTHRADATEHPGPSSPHDLQVILPAHPPPLTLPAAVALLAFLRAEMNQPRPPTG